MFQIRYSVENGLVNVFLRLYSKRRRHLDLLFSVCPQYQNGIRGHLVQLIGHFVTGRCPNSKQNKEL